MKCIDVEQFKERALNMPGAITIIVLLSLFLPMTNIMPYEITIPLLIVFSVPIVWVFLWRTLTNKKVSLGKHLTITIFLSYIFFIITSDLSTAMFFYINSIFFLLALGISGFVYIVYYLFFLVGKKYAQKNYRKRFVIVFIPTLVISIVFLWLMSAMFGDVLFGMANVLAGAVNG